MCLCSVPWCMLCGAEEVQVEHIRLTPRVERRSCFNLLKVQCFQAFLSFQISTTRLEHIRLTPRVLKALVFQLVESAVQVESAVLSSLLSFKFSTTTTRVVPACRRRSCFRCLPTASCRQEALGALNNSIWLYDHTYVNIFW